MGLETLLHYICIICCLALLVIGKRLPAQTRSIFSSAVLRRDVRQLPGLIKDLYDGQTDDPFCRIDSTALISSMDALNPKVTARVRETGLKYLMSLQDDECGRIKIPRSHLLLAILKMEFMARPALDPVHASVLPVFAMMLNDFAQNLPSYDQFQREVVESPWLAWPHLERVRMALLQQAGAEEGKASDVVAMAVVDAVVNDRCREMQLLWTLSHAASLEQHLGIDEIISTVCSATNRLRLYSEAVAMLDALVALPSNTFLSNALHFLRGGESNGEKWKRGLGWGKLRSSSILQASVADISWPDAMLQQLAENSKNVHVLCLGDGDMSHAIALDTRLEKLQRPHSICTTSLHSREEFLSLYRRDGMANLEELNRRGVTTLFNIDVCHCAKKFTDALPLHLPGNVSAWVIFNFPFNDAKKNCSSSQFDTFYMATGRHVDLIESTFITSTDVLRASGGYVVFTLLMIQAVGWQVQSIGRRLGYTLEKVIPLDATGFYSVRRSNVDSGFPHGVVGDNSSLAKSYAFVFFKIVDTIDF